MENASKALLIAGGILFALMILSLVVYMAGATTRMAEAQDEKVATEQLAAFNREYESYNKSRMYGTDVITVARKAINYNTKNNIPIRIEINIKNDYSTTERRIIGGVYGIVDDKTDLIGELSLKAGKHTINGHPYERIIRFFGQEIDDITTTSKISITTITIIRYSALAKFKRSIFTCTNCEYDENTGRISQMTFEEILN